MPLEFYNLLFINYAGRQDGLVLKKIEKQTQELKQEIKDSKENQTKGHQKLSDDIKNLTLKFETWACEGRVKVHFKEKLRVKIVTKRITSFWKHHIYVNFVIAIINKD